MTTHQLPRTAPHDEPTNHDDLHELPPLNPNQLAAHHHTRLHTFGT